MQIVAIADVTSHAMLLILKPYADPLRPMSCSADKFVSSIDPAMNTPVSPRPARK